MRGNRFLAVLLLTVMLFALVGCKAKTESRTGIYFNTAVTLEAVGGLPNGAFALCERYDKLLSATNTDSEIYKINSNGGGSVSDDTAVVINEALKYSNLSGGKFDITVYPLKQLWGFGENERVPSEAEIQKAMRLVNYKSIKINGNSVTLLNGAKIDLGGIAKGYIADKLAELYIKEEKEGIINLGGNIMLPLERKEPYKIGVTDPMDKAKTKAIIEVKKGAVVTSGTYERNFKESGKTYHHILDTSTGYPANTGIASATVISPSATAADALSTAVLCLGEKDGLKLINSLDNTEAVLITDGGEILLSSGLKMQGETISVN